MLKSLFILLVSVSGLRALSPGPIGEDLVLEGRIISAPAHPNLEDALQVNHRSASMTQNGRTAYLQDADGRHGVKLVFRHLDPEARKMERYAWARINLKDAVLSIEDGGYVVREIPNDAVLSVERGSASDLPAKTRSPRTLTDEDLFTWVSIPECEFVFKDGSYCNILESYAVKPSGETTLGGNGYMGTWQTLLTNADGAPLYAVINSRVPWRRSGGGVPQGSGSLSGIYVKTDIARYGKVRAPQIRPLDEEDFHFTEGPTAFSTLCEWNWNDNRKEIRTEEGPMTCVKRQKILPDVGEGRLWTDFEASNYRGRDCNNPAMEPDEGYVLGHRGQVVHGALQVRTMASNWWDWREDCGSAIVVKFSTEGIRGQRLAFAFTFAAGDNSAANTRMCPVYWGVEVSTDNVHVARVDIPDIMARPLPWPTKSFDGVTYWTSEEAGMGLTEHLVVLPSSLFGQKEVYVRIAPVRRNAYTLGMRLSTNAFLRPNDNVLTYMEFGAVKVIYR